MKHSVLTSSSGCLDSARIAVGCVCGYEGSRVKGTAQGWMVGIVPKWLHYVANWHNWCSRSAALWGHESVMHFSMDLWKTFALLLRMQTWHARGAYACGYITSERWISSTAYTFLSPASWSWHQPASKAHRSKMLTCLCHVYLSSVFVLAVSYGVCAGIASTLRSEMGHSVSKPGNGPKQTPSSALQSKCIKVQPKSLPLEICVCYDNPSIVKLYHTDFCVYYCTWV